MKRVIAISTVVVLVVFACDKADSPLGPSVPQVTFQLSVVDPLGEPVPGLRISMWNHLSDYLPDLDRSQAGSASSAVVGDINCNGTPWEIADAVMFSQYFVIGLEAFGSNDICSVNASDVNQDGNPLSLADFQYLIRVIGGDAIPWPKTDTVYTGLSTYGHYVEVADEMGAAYIVAAGDQQPDLWTDNMDMIYAFDGRNTRILVHSFQEGETFSGEFIHVENVIYVEFATYEGEPVALVDFPAYFSVGQSYPNPASSSATIRTYVPSPCAIDLVLFDLAGRTAESYHQDLAQGCSEYEWTLSSSHRTVYKYVVRASCSGTSYESDVKYTAFWSDDPDSSVIGYTSAVGVFTTQDPTLFPNLYSLPLLPLMSAGGSRMGTFSYLDDITIVLTDTATGRSQEYIQTVQEGKNSFRLIWDPTS